MNSKEIETIKSLIEKIEGFNSSEGVHKGDLIPLKLILKAMHSGGSIRPCFYAGSGADTYTVDFTSEVRHILDTHSIKYSFTNDAKRGSRTGNLITLINYVK